MDDLAADDDQVRTHYLASCGIGDATGG